MDSHLTTSPSTFPYFQIIWDCVRVGKYFFSLGIFGFSLTFDDKADVLFNMTLVHQEYVNGTKENTNCDPFNNDFPCMGKLDEVRDSQGRKVVDN